MNLENLNVQELNTEEQKNVDGGSMEQNYAEWKAIREALFLENGIVWP